MTLYAHPDVLASGPDFIRDNCNSIVLLDAYAFNDSYATVISNVMAQVAMTSSDFTLAAAGNNQALTTALKVAPSATASGTAMNIGFLDTVNSRVLWITRETSGTPVVTGLSVTFPSLTYTATQPVEAGGTPPVDPPSPPPSGVCADIAYDTVLVAATTAAIRSAPVQVAGLTCVTSTSLNVRLYSNNANSGTVIWEGAVTPGQIVRLPAPYSSFLGVSVQFVSGTGSINLFVR